MKIVSKIMWLLSGLGFVVTLFVTYGDMSEQVWIDFPMNIGQQQMTKSAYFYGAIGFFVFINLLLVTIANFLAMLPKAFVFVPKRNYWLENKYNREALNKILQSWVFCSACVINVFLMAVLEFFGAANHVDSSIMFTKQWLFTLAGIMAVTLITPIFRLFITKNSLLDNTGVE